MIISWTTVFSLHLQSGGKYSPYWYWTRAIGQIPDANRGITSSDLVDAAEAAGRPIEVRSNFFLFFKSELLSTRSLTIPGRRRALACQASRRLGYKRACPTEK